MSKKMFAMTEFAKRHFASDFKGTRITSVSPEEFVDTLNKNYGEVGTFYKGYAPFCKHLFIINFTNAKSGVVEITDKNRHLLKSGYNARQENELPVLTRWFDSKDVYVPVATYLDIILYSREQMLKEKDDIGKAKWGIVSINGQMECEEHPMNPITMMRNALGISEGGSGYPLHRGTYVKAVEYWDSHAIVLNFEEDTVVLDFKEDVIKDTTKAKKKLNINQDQGENFRDKDGKLFLVRCYVCDPEHGLENHAMLVASGTCAWCGWSEKENVKDKKKGKKERS